MSVIFSIQKPSIQNSVSVSNLSQMLEVTNVTSGGTITRKNNGHHASMKATKKIFKIQKVTRYGSYARRPRVEKDQKFIDTIKVSNEDQLKANLNYNQQYRCRYTDTMFLEKDYSILPMDHYLKLFVPENLYPKNLNQGFMPYSNVSENKFDFKMYA